MLELQQELQGFKLIAGMSSLLLLSVLGFLLLLPLLLPFVFVFVFVFSSSLSALPLDYPISPWVSVHQDGADLQMTMNAI